MRARLVPVEGKFAPFELSKDVIVVGRQTECDIRLEHRGVSKLHCILIRTDGLFLLRDLGSTNGTRVNGTRIRRAALLPNDSIHLGSMKFKIEFGGDQSVLPSDLTYAELKPEKVSTEMSENENEDAELVDGDDEIPSVQMNALPDKYPEEE